MRPRHLIGILGTHTEVGKTYVAARWLRQLRERGLRVAARKPVQSFAAADAHTDADQLAAATGERVETVCSRERNYSLPLAPPMAADQLKRPRIYLDDVQREIVWAPALDVGVVETVGGPRSPLAHDGDSIDLLHRLGVDCAVLIADAGLGTLNAVRLCLPCIAPLPVLVYLNGFDAANELHVLNRRWLVERYEVVAATTVDELTRRILNS